MSWDNIDKCAALFLDVPGIKVLDRSFIPFFLDEGVENYSPQMQSRLMQFEETFYDVLPLLFELDVLLPEEVVKECADHVDAFIEGCKDRERDLSLMERRNMGYIIDNEKNIVNLLCKRETLFNRHYESHSLEDFIPEEIIQYLPMIKNAMYELSKKRKILRNYNMRHQKIMNGRRSIVRMI